MQSVPSPVALRFWAEGESPQPSEDSFCQICGKLEEAKLTAPVSEAQLLAPTAQAHKRPAAPVDSREKICVWADIWLGPREKGCLD